MADGLIVRWTRRSNGIRRWIFYSVFFSEYCPADAIRVTSAWFWFQLLYGGYIADKLKPVSFYVVAGWF